MAPSVNATRSTKPPTRGRTSTLFTDSKWPVNSSSSATGRVIAGATVTWGGGGADCAFSHPAPSHPARSRAMTDRRCERLRNPVVLMRALLLRNEVVRHFPGHPVYVTD